MQSSRTASATRAILTAAILLLAIALRFVGLRWGLPTTELPHPPFHCDEATSIEYLRQMDWGAGKFNPVSAHSEGTLSVYLWMAGAYVLKAAGLLERYAHQLTVYDDDYARYVLYGRISVVLCDLASLLLVFLILRRLLSQTRGAADRDGSGDPSGGAATAPYWGMLIWAILPFEVIYAHYMRPHVVGNTIILLIVYASLFLVTEADGEASVSKTAIPVRFRRALLAGLACGFATANRYTYVVTLSIPILLIYHDRWKERTAGPSRGVRRLMTVLFDPRVFVVLASWLLGFFLGDMPFFLRHSEITPDIKYQLSYVLPATHWYDLTRPLHYVTDVIPKGTGMLWLVFYPALAYGLFVKRYRPYFMAWLAFCLVYFLPSSRAYPLYAIRLALPLFPVFTLTGALLLQDLFRVGAGTGVRTLFRRAAAVAVAGVFVTTAAFTWAAVRSMADSASDPYLQFVRYFEDLRKNGSIGGTSSLEFGFVSDGWNWYQPDNFGALLDGARIRHGGEGDVDFTAPENRVDYVIVFRFDHPNDEKLKPKMRELTDSKVYRLEKVFRRDISFFNVVIRYDRYPHDFMYPYPEIYLFKKVERDGMS